jgi:hypothetical protein
MENELLAVMRKHLPPSATHLHLLDIGGMSHFGERDFEVTIVNGAAASWRLAPFAFDAVVACDVDLTADVLAACLDVLRPGGRLIVAQSTGRVSADQVKLLEDAGYTRVLVEAVLAGSVLLRGEKPHTEQRTMDRIQQVAGRDSAATLTDFKGRYVHLLIRQTPNKPVWALRPGELVEWHAAAITDDNGPLLLAFSSLPRAVAFMQPAVMQGIIRDVNKVGKFSRAAAQDWPLLFNPDLDSIADRTIVYVPVDSNLAETPDE